MDYETYLIVKQYHPNREVYYTLRVTDSENIEYFYDGQCSTLDDVMNSIKPHLKQHQN